MNLPFAFVNFSYGSDQWHNGRSNGRYLTVSSDVAVSKQFGYPELPWFSNGFVFFPVKYCKCWKAHRIDAYMLLCLGKVIEESAWTRVAVGRKAFSISNSWLFASHMMQIPGENGCCET